MCIATIARLGKCPISAHHFPFKFTDKTGKDVMLLINSTITLFSLDKLMLFTHFVPILKKCKQAELSLVGCFCRKNN